eukprot:8134604-Prorocentrum_lima.AAC.1
MAPPPSNADSRRACASTCSRSTLTSFRRGAISSRIVVATSPRMLPTHSSRSSALMAGSIASK